MKNFKILLPGFFNSIFIKLIVIFLIALICINIFVAVFFKIISSRTYMVSFQKNILEHIYYIIDELGNNPDIERGKHIALKTSFDVFYKGKNTSWSTSDRQLSFEELKERLKNPHKPKKHLGHRFRNEFVQRLNQNRQTTLQNYYKSLLENNSSAFKTDELEKQIKKLDKLPDIRIGLYRGQTLILYETNDESFLFLKESIFENNSSWLIITLIAILSIFMLIVYLLIRKILFPIKELSQGVENIRSGNLDYQIDSRSSDELGQLTDAFNKMARELKEIIHSKEQLLLDVSHELRSPLTRINVALEYLPKAEIPESIREDTREIEAMITELLENARLSNENAQLNREKIFINKFISSLIENSNEYKNRVFFSNISGIKTIIFDPKQLKIVIQNILDNAIKYSKNIDDPINISVIKQTRETLISIQDDGPGISEDKIPFIFDPFYRVDKSRSKKTGGYGLGLSLCKKIMQAHSGRIKADSKVGDGTTITLYFKHDS